MSLFDQFANEYPPPVAAPVVLEPAYPAVRTQGGNPVFQLDRVQIPFAVVNLVCVAVANSLLAMAVEGHATGGAARDPAAPRVQRIFRILLTQGDAIEEIELQPRQKGDRIRRLFLDPTARHMLISTEAGDNYYLFDRWQKPRPLSKMRGVIVESIAWGKPRSGSADPSTGVILIGSRQGHIYEAELQPTDEFFKREERYFKQVYSAVGDNMPICGLRYERFPAVPRKYIVIAATPNRLNQFIGTVSDAGGDGGIFGDLFRTHENYYGA
ncbi:hypothetical protein BDK51DRAFT_33944 [Blyttiomyces helicus]|uniref:Pep3/Vps18 beta-propeller domain-containing protein n=1 Tax=Blyttiomyces helicus TaxID=388810 RepID=A0A4P9VWT5_9FUNG|nr:hypothetical protein BDK51DRAFT_33944 [Blyttiomyces helicus]|eukprot:RKO83325.1 hypothetical protein BDK51DRAFT_33944 [Blyttiomyces helicus]